ncbi:hypothetical protein P152DRAFT_247900 [Eremomyces bilateralis CBS 781.70]|uniref:Uncharacterized protein n=1 Tax=Eremomyces bilateralis CBS 781.70 TaxID=1392243 RepID=A0A6G1GAP4_9PEZI|nr:uncharacterized protein P152DRAFT_247900 [Eremomyces bilateralis CBS 781.70]KAF1815167.1 hypothetical protein P152DRAFT_247900 [Eremomyces bilateralis CBS 781.70]
MTDHLIFVASRNHQYNHCLSCWVRVIRVQVRILFWTWYGGPESFGIACATMAFLSSLLPYSNP